MSLENIVIQELNSALNTYVTENINIDKLIERPKNSDFGDFSFPTFSLAKIKHLSPNIIANELAEKIDSSKFRAVKVVGSYINFYVLRNTPTKDILQSINELESNYGKNNIGKGRNVTIDMSSPNIAKPMSMGHLRSTVIGNSLANIEKKSGYNPIKINYLGDWGTQFGKLLAAYNLWGSKEDVEKDPIESLLKLYVRYNKAAKDDEKLNDLGRAWFKKLEDGDQESLNLWSWFREVSLKRFNDIYKKLGINFDSYNGEAFYNDKIDGVVKKLKDDDLLSESQGAQVVDLSKEGFDIPALIIRSDGASLYITRDLAAAIYRKNKTHSAKSIYVAGSEQTQHFAMLKAILHKMGYSWANEIVHVSFGMITYQGKKLSTREGRIILLEDVLKDAYNLALSQIEEKNPDLPNKEKVAEQVGFGAVIFHDLKNDRTENFDFKLDEVVQFEGDTGPYVQYTNARAQSILRKSNNLNIFNKSLLNIFKDNDQGFEVIKLLDLYPKVVVNAESKYEPSIIAKYSLQLAKSFNRYYKNNKILIEDDGLYTRLQLVSAVSLILQDSLNLLGIEAPSQM